MIDFIIRGRSTRPGGRIRAQGSALTRNVEEHMTRRALLLPFRSKARRVIMHAGEGSWPLRAKLFMASRVFKRDVLLIHLSEFHAGLEEHSLGIKERSCVNGMLVIITSAEISRRTGSVT